MSGFFWILSGFLVFIIPNLLLVFSGMIGVIAGLKRSVIGHLTVRNLLTRRVYY